MLDHAAWNVSHRPNFMSSKPPLRPNRLLIRPCNNVLVVRYLLWILASLDCLNAVSTFGCKQEVDPLVDLDFVPAKLEPFTCVRSFETKVTRQVSVVYTDEQDFIARVIYLLEHCVAFGVEVSN